MLRNSSSIPLSRYLSKDNNMGKCKICGKEFLGKKMGGHVSAAHSESHRKSLKINFESRVKIIKKTCPKCNKEFEVEGREINGKYKSLKNENQYCSRKCANGHIQTKGQNDKRSIANKNKTPWNKDFSLIYFSFCKSCKRSLGAKNKSGYCRSCFNKTTEYKNKMSIIMKERCKNIDERKRLRDIGRNGGFGKKGYTKGNNRYESDFEKNCFEFLEENKIKFEAHKYIPNSSKVSDIYLIDFNKWVELDGIDRRKIKKYKTFENNYKRWEEKIKLYKELELDYSIVYNMTEFVNLIRAISSAGRALGLHPRGFVGSSPTSPNLIKLDKRAKYD